MYKCVKLGEITIEGNVAFWVYDMTRYICCVILAVKRKIVLSADMTIAQVAGYKVYRLSEVE